MQDARNEKETFRRVLRRVLCFSAGTTMQYVDMPNDDWCAVLYWRERWPLLLLDVASARLGRTHANSPSSRRLEAEDDWGGAVAVQYAYVSKKVGGKKQGGRQIFERVGRRASPARPTDN